MIKLTLLVTLLSLLNAAPPVTKESPFACNLNGLTAAEKIRHFIVLGPALRSAKSGVREIADGYEFLFRSDAKTFAMLTEWIEQERRCCPFFDFELRLPREGGPMSMRLTGRKGTKEFIREEF